MAHTASESNSFLIGNIKRLPVVASQDQEFWLAAAISCRRLLTAAVQSESRPLSCEISTEILGAVFVRCLDSHARLLTGHLLESRVPTWEELLTEALDARERIFQFRLSRLFRCLNGPCREEDGKRAATAIAMEIAECLSVFPLGFLRFWRASLVSKSGKSGNDGTNLPTSVALLYLRSVDRSALRASIEAGVHKARETLIEGYLRYSLRLALGYVNRGIEYADLVQEAALGLVFAAQKYDYLEHGRFALFANIWMWQYITRSLANDSRLIRLPVHADQKLDDVRKELTQWVAETGQAGSLDTFIESKGPVGRKYLELLAAGLTPVRLDAPMPMLTRREVESLMPENTTLPADVHGRILAAVSENLKPLEQDVLWLRFGLYDGEEYTLEEIGQRYGVTRERIRQIESKALRVLRGPTTIRQLLLKRATAHGQQVPACASVRTLQTITCDEVLGTGHSYLAEDRHALNAILNSSFGSRQSIVRQGLTIKGRILDAFEMLGPPLHTREIRECLGVLYPSEEFRETTLYSVMAGSPGTFVSYGDGLFGIAAGDDTREHADLNAPETAPMPEFAAVSVPEAPTEDHSSGLLHGCEPESPQFTFQALERILVASETIRREGIWSVVELTWTKEDLDRLTRWAQIGRVDVRTLAAQRISFGGTLFFGIDGLALAILVLCSDIAQRDAVEGDMWSHVSGSLGPQLRHGLFSGRGFPRSFLRDATEEICRKLRIRHAFGREGEQSWLRTVFLQFGLSKSGYRRLPFWLGQGTVPPVAVQDLIDHGSRLYSQTFSSLWDVLKRFRWGFLLQREAAAALEGNPWIPAEDRQEILAAAASRRDTEHVTAGGENTNEPWMAAGVLAEPRLRWGAAEPFFEIRLRPTPPTWLDGDRYVLTIPDQRVTVLRDGSEWRIDNADGAVEVGFEQPVLQADMLQRGVSVLASPLEIRLTPEPDAFGIYDLATGRLVDPARRGHDFSRPAAILCRTAITILPATNEFYRAFQNEWIFWVFRRGLPANLVIRDGELTLWRLEMIDREAPPEVARSNRMAVSSFGGWWGETVRVSVTSLPGIKLLRLRIGSQRIDLEPAPPGQFRGHLPLLAGADYSATAYMECLNEGSLERRTADLHLAEVNGVALESESGWKAFDGARDIDIEYFQTRRVLVHLPMSWAGETRQPADWVFLEGTHFCQRHHQSVFSLRDSLYGVGEPLVLSIGPYNYSSLPRRLTRSVLNSGVIRRVHVEGDHWTLHLRHSLDPGEGHAVWVWMAGEAAPRKLSRDEWSQQENIFEVRPAFDGSPAEFAISNDGAWLGARTASSGLYGLQQIMEQTPSWRITAGWLRWWQAPLLHDSLSATLKATAGANPVLTLAAWLTGDSPGAGAEYLESHRDAWLSVARSALWRWCPSQTKAGDALRAMGMMTGQPEIDVADCWNGFEAILALSPMLLAQLAARGVREIYPGPFAAERQSFLHMLRALVLGLDRNATNAECRSRFADCKRDAAESMSVDEKFITDGLLPLALRVVEGKAGQDLNLRIALANSPIRKFLAFSLIQHATGEQTQ